MESWSPTLVGGFLTTREAPKSPLLPPLHMLALLMNYCPWSHFTLQFRLPDLFMSQRNLFSPVVEHLSVCFVYKAVICVKIQWDEADN